MKDALRNWEPMWGARYNYPDLKDGAVRYAINGIDLPDNPLIVDYGCGAFPVSGLIDLAEGKHPAIAYIDVVDTGTIYDDDKEPIALDDKHMLIGGDLDHMAAKTPQGRPASKLLRRFLTAHSQEGKPEADLAILSDILNYINYKRVLKFAADFLRVGGRLLVVNEANRGNSHAFSPLGVKNDGELIMHIAEELPFAVESIIQTSTMFSLGETALILTATKRSEQSS